MSRTQPTKSFWATVLVSVLFASVLLAGARAAPEEAANSLVDLKTQRVIDAIPSRSATLPTSLKSDSDIYLIITVGTAYIDVKAVARPTVAAYRLGADLENSIADTSLAGTTVQWSHDDEYSAAGFTYTTGRLGASSSSVCAPIGVIVTGMNARGYKSHSLLRLVQYYGHTDGRSTLLGRRLLQWTDVSKAAASTNWTNQASIDRSTILMTWLFLLLVPIIGITSLITAILIGRRTSIPVEIRRRLYTKMALYPTLGAIAVHLPLAIVFLQSARSFLLADLWFGSPSISSVFSPFIMAGPMSMMLVLPIATRTEQKLFGRADGKTLDAGSISSVKNPVRTRLIALGFLLPLVGLAVHGYAKFQIPVHNPLRYPLEYGGIVLAVLAILWNASRTTALTSAQYVDDAALQAHVDELANRLHAGNFRARIDDSAAGRGFASAKLLPKATLVVSRSYYDQLTPKELEWVLAHEMAHARERHLARSLAIQLIPVLVAICCVLLFMANAQKEISHSAIQLLVWVPMFCYLVMLPLGRWVSQRFEYMADRIALETVGDLVAAESALRKLIENSSMPYIHDATDIGTHPRFSKRIASMRQWATEMGLKIPSGNG